MNMAAWFMPNITLTLMSVILRSFDYGPAHVAVVDQYASYGVGSAQYTWLQNDLANSNKPWKFILLHEPGWSAGGGHENNTTVQSAIQPLCETYGVRLVLGGHNHYYARCDVNGIQHVTIGSAAAPLYTPNLSYPNVVTAESVYHFAEITLAGDTLMMTVRRGDGTVLDSYVYNCIDVPPTGLTATAGNAEIDLKWVTSTGATSYNVYRHTVSGGPYSQIATNVTSNTYTDNAVQWHDVLLCGYGSQ
jgi:hypothetical protein